MIYDLRIIINAFNFIERKIFEEEDILNKIDKERDRGFNKSIDILPSIHVKIYESIDISVNS